MKEIVVVDDERRIVDLLGMVLKGEGYSVQTYLDPAEALTIVRLPNLIITDLQMPRMGGLDFLRELRAKFPKDYISYLLMTGATPENPEFKAFEEAEGLENVLHKPFEVDDLLECVKRKVA